MPLSYGTLSHLCASIAQESAAALSAGSNAPVLTLPACRQTSVLSSSGGSASARILPWPSTGTRITRSPPRPTSISALSTLTWTSSPTTTVMGGAPNRPCASTFQPLRASSAWRAAADLKNSPAWHRSRTPRRTLVAAPARRAASAWRLVPDVQQWVRGRRSRRSDPTRRPGCSPPLRLGVTHRPRTRRSGRPPMPSSRGIRCRRAAESPPPGRSDAPGAAHPVVADWRGPRAWGPPRGLAIRLDSVPPARRSLAEDLPSVVPYDEPLRSAARVAGPGRVNDPVPRQGARHSRAGNCAAGGGAGASADIGDADAAPVHGTREVTV